MRPLGEFDRRDFEQRETKPIMNRRDLLRRALALTTLPASVGSPFLMARAAAPRPMRRVRAKDHDWPSEDKWRTLSQAVEGRLAKVAPLLAACSGSRDDPRCAEVLKNLRNPFYLGDQPGGTEVSGWVDAWTPEPSAYVVSAQRTADVVAAVNFARTNNLRLVVKGGGHSYQGTSNSKDSLLIWTRAMHGITMHDAFTPVGCNVKPQPAVTVESGAMWIDVYGAVTTKAGRYVQGGGCATVGVAGLISSGGFGSFSKNYGMAAAGLLEAEIVTADGSVRRVNACKDPDLFWAIKGGGGGSFGALTKLTLRTRELPEWFGSATMTIAAQSEESYRRLVGRFLAFYAESLMNPHWGEEIAIRRDNTLKITMVSAGVDEKQGTNLWKPFVDWVKASPKDFKFTDGPDIGTMPARHWWDAEYRRAHGSKAMIDDSRAGVPATHAWWSGDQDQVGALIYGFESIWLPASLLRKDQQKRLADALVNGSRHWEIELHLNKGLAGAPADAQSAARDTAMNPAAIDAFALVIIANGGPPAYPELRGAAPDLAAARKDAAAVTRAVAPLEALAPHGGAYVSESNYFDKDWQRSYWGKNYGRLQSVKAKYDPDGLFFVHHGVGSEEWSADGFIRRKAR